VDTDRYYYIADYRVAGLFSCVNRVLNICQEFEKYNLIPLVWWGDSNCYWENGGYRGSVNVWEYYFEPLSGISLDSEPNRNKIRSINPKINPIVKDGVAPRGKDVGNLYFPNRVRGHETIQKYLRIRKEILAIAQDFCRLHFKSYTIGLHLRGPGRYHGGSSWIRKHFTLRRNVPFDLYFEYVYQELEQHSDAVIFLATDADIVKQECIREFGDRVVTINHDLSPEGNDHLKNQGGPRAAKAGEECLIDAIALSYTNYFVHATSNVSNFVCCYNRDLRDINVYEAGLKKKGIDLRKIM